MFNSTQNIQDYQILLTNPAQKRDLFDQHPTFIKMSLVYFNKYRSIRKQRLRQRIIAAELLKERGNRFFQAGNYAQAVREYEQSLTIFTYIEPKFPNQKPLDMKNEDFVFHETQCEDESDNMILLSACYLWMGQNYYIDAVKACDYALQIDRYSVKALYRRGKARRMNPNITEEQLQLAIEDLRQAISYDQNGNDDIRKEIIKVQEELKFLQKKNEVKLQHKQKPAPIIKSSSLSQQNTSESPEIQKPKHFHSSETEKRSFQPTLQQQQQDLINQYRRNNAHYDTKRESDDEESQDNYYSDSEEEDQETSQLNQQEMLKHFNYELSYEEDPNKPIPVEVQELGKFIETRGVEILKLYETSGRRQEAQELKEKLKKALAAKKQLEKISQLDFNKPKQKLQKIAESFGIDLYDPHVQNEFKKIQNQNLEDIRTWLKQNQWEYAQEQKLQTNTQFSDESQQPQPSMTGKKRSKGPPRHKCKFNKKRSEPPPKVKITKQVIYNQTMKNEQNIHNYNNVTNQIYNNVPMATQTGDPNNKFYQQNMFDSRNNDTQQQAKFNDEDQYDGCCGFLLNNFLIVIFFSLLILAIYYQYFK